VIRTVVLSKRAQKDIMTVPDHIVAKLQGWVLDVEYRGLEEVRKVPSYHDEPLKGPLKGLRSIRLSLSYRASTDWSKTRLSSSTSKGLINMSTKKSEAIRLLEKRTGGPLTLGRFVEAIRLGEDMTQPAFAKQLGISKSHLNDIEKGRKAVSPERAARFAEVLGYSQANFVKLALQDLVSRGGLPFQVDVKAA